MITSRKNPKIQELRGLLAKKSLREQSGLCVLEGTRLLEEALLAAWQPLYGFYVESHQRRNKDLLHQITMQGAIMEEVPEDLLAYMADTTNPQGMIAVFRKETIPLPSVPDFVLILDAIRDPGNMGTILRTAAAASVDIVLLTDDCVDPFSPKVLRSGMGAQFHLPLHMDTISGILSYSQQHKLSIHISDASAGTSCWQQDFRVPLCMVISNEANGTSSDFLTAETTLTKIPMPGGFESLNAAVAAAILLFEVVRQRQS